MGTAEFKRYVIALALCCLSAAVLSALWKIPYLYTGIGFAAWIFADLPGGWSNPDDSRPFPWRELAIKGAALFGLVGLAIFHPLLRTLGA